MEEAGATFQIIPRYDASKFKIRWIMSINKTCVHNPCNSRNQVQIHKEKTKKDKLICLIVSFVLLSFCNTVHARLSFFLPYELGYENSRDCKHASREHSQLFFRRIANIEDLVHMGASDAFSNSWKSYFWVSKKWEKYSHVANNYLSRKHAKKNHVQILYIFGYTKMTNI
jgi:hypothetical protein